MDFPSGKLNKSCITRKMRITHGIPLIIQGAAGIMNFLAIKQAMEMGYR